MLRRLAAALLSFSALLVAQTNPEPIVIGERVEVPSNVLGERRTIHIGKPQGYEEGDKRYPVVYLLDGGKEAFHHVSGILNFLQVAGRAPGMLLVGIPNTNRTRDLTPPTHAERGQRLFPKAGGADYFLQFISDELMPWIEDKYRTRPYKVLIGHSLGGLFAIHSLTSRPEVFNAYIAIDSSMWWSEQGLVAQAEAFFSKKKRLELDFYYTMTAEGGGAASGSRKLAGILEEKSPVGFRWNLARMAGEDHISIVHRSVYNGLETIFDGWYLQDPYERYKLGGLEAVHKHFEEGGKRYGYDRETSPFVLSLIVAGLIQDGLLSEAGEVLLHDRERYPRPWNQLEALARNYLERNNSERAIHYFKLALEANPDSSSAKEALAKLGDENSQ